MLTASSPSAPYIAAAQAALKWAQLRQEKEKKAADDRTGYNPLFFLRPNENAHSRMVADLLDPQGSHKQGFLFLETLLNMAGLSDLTALPVSDWSAASGLGFVDIRLHHRTSGHVIVIENKCHEAVDQPNQLYRYWWQEASRHPSENDRVKVIYLGGSADLKPGHQSLQRPDDLQADRACVPEEALCFLNLKDLARSWKEKITDRDPQKSAHLKAFLEQYFEFWNADMNQILADNATTAFDDLEAWHAFTELKNHYDLIREHWLATGAAAVREQFKNRPSPGWACIQWGAPRDTFWYLEQYGQNSIGIGFGWPEHGFYLADFSTPKQQNEKALQILEDVKFKRLREVFPQPKSSRPVLLTADTFEYPADPAVDRETSLPWYAQHKKEEYADHMAAKVRKVTEDAELTGLIGELNRAAGIPSK